MERLEWMRPQRRFHRWQLIITLLIALFVGNRLGDLLSGWIPIAGAIQEFGFAPVKLALLDLDFQFGLLFHINVVGGILALLALFFFRR